MTPATHGTRTHWALLTGLSALTATAAAHAQPLTPAPAPTTTEPQRPRATLPADASAATRREPTTASLIDDPTATVYELTANGEWEVTQQPVDGTDAGTMNLARRQIAEGRGDLARLTLNEWLSVNERTDNPFVPEAVYLRGCAKLVRGHEWKALYDFERLVRDFPASEFFSRALQKELDIARLYLNGRRKPAFGSFLRIDSGTPYGEEICLRINERLPGSRLAEEATLVLADYYYRERELKMAVEVYDSFLRIFPRSEYRQLAMQRRIFANIAQFKGPSYDGRVLIDAKYQVEDFKQEFPRKAEELGLSDAVVARLDESSAQQMLTTAKWYIRRDDDVSARLTLSRLVRRHPRSAAAQDALTIIEEKGWATQPDANANTGTDAGPSSQTNTSPEAPTTPEAAK